MLVAVFGDVTCTVVVVVVVCFLPPNSDDNSDDDDDADDDSVTTVVIVVVVTDDFFVDEDGASLTVEVFVELELVTVPLVVEGVDVVCLVGVAADDDDDETTTAGVDARFVKVAVFAADVSAALLDVVVDVLDVNGSVLVPG